MGTIKKIKIENFKSFKKLEVDLGGFNVLIGANASGKSNFISIFKFLKDIIDEGLDNAVSMQGGIEYFRNINIGPAENFSVEIVCDYANENDQIKNGNGLVETKTIEVNYGFALEMMKEVSALKQIIVTTHNPEVLKYSFPGDILFIARDKEESCPVFPENSA